MFRVRFGFLISLFKARKKISYFFITLFFPFFYYWFLFSFEQKTKKFNGEEQRNLFDFFFLATFWVCMHSLLSINSKVQFITKLTSSICKPMVGNCDWREKKKMCENLKKRNFWTVKQLFLKESGWIWFFLFQLFFFFKLFFFKLFSVFFSFPFFFFFFFFFFFLK